MPARAIVRFAGSVDAIVNRTVKPKRVVLRQVEGRRLRYAFPFGPKQVRYEGNGIEYISVERPGLISLLEADSIKPRVVAFTAVIATAGDGGKSSVESHIRLLTNMARQDSDLVFVYGNRSLGYRVRITDLSFDSIQRRLDGHITQATATIQLTERPRRNIDTVTLDAIRYTPTSSPPKKTTKTTARSTKPSAPSNAEDNNYIYVGPKGTVNPADVKFFK